MIKLKTILNKILRNKKILHNMPERDTKAIIMDGILVRHLYSPQKQKEVEAMYLREENSVHFFRF
jgi:hypothetical protein